MGKVSANFKIENKTAETIFDERALTLGWNDHVRESVQTMIDWNIEDNWVEFICNEDDPNLFEKCKLVSGIFPLPKGDWMRLIFDGRPIN
jgi:hypothetical protein